MKTNKKNLIALFENLKAGLSGANETTEQSNCFAFVDKRVHTYNDEISVSAPNPFPRFSNAAISSKEILALLSKLSEEEIDISFSDTEMHIKSGRVKAGLILQNNIEMPIQEIIFPEKWYSLPAEFKDGIRNCITTVGKDEGQSILMQLHCSDMIIQSSDNEKASRSFMKSKFRKAMLIHSTAAKYLIGIDELDKYYPDKDWTHFKTKNDVIFSCRNENIPREYPDLSEYFNPDGFSFRFPVGMGKILERASVFAETAFEHENLVQIIITEKGTIKVRAEGETGWIEETKRIKQKPDTEIKFSINPRNLQQILKQQSYETIVGSELIWLETENFKFVASLEG